MKELTIGTDCSGIEAPIQALKQMKRSFRHLWACDYDKYSKESIYANYSPETWYDNMVTRNNKTLPKTDLDIYVCGFPCQPFSLMGKKQGTKDKRGNIMMECVSVIKYKLPKIFILENVKNFKSIQNGEPFNFLIKTLENIKDPKNKEKAYNIYYDVLNTRDYGIPQNRERIFIIGIKKEHQKIENGYYVDYTTPKVKKCKKLDDFIIDKKIANINISNSLQKNLNKIKGNGDFLVTPFTFYSAMKNFCPTLTTKCSSYYHTKYKRNLSPKECLLLQGFSKNFKQVVSNAQLYRQAGNSMSVCVLKELFKEIFKITNL